MNIAIFITCESKKVIPRQW